MLREPRGFLIYLLFYIHLKLSEKSIYGDLSWSKNIIKFTLVLLVLWLPIFYNFKQNQTTLIIILSSLFLHSDQILIFVRLKTIFSSILPRQYTIWGMIGECWGMTGDWWVLRYDWWVLRYDWWVLRYDW